MGWWSGVTDTILFGTSVKHSSLPATRVCPPLLSRPSSSSSNVSSPATFYSLFSFYPSHPIPPPRISQHAPGTLMCIRHLPVCTVNIINTIFANKMSHVLLSVLLLPRAANHSASYFPACIWHLSHAILERRRLWNGTAGNAAKELTNVLLSPK